MSAPTIRTADLSHGHRYRIPGREGGVWDGTYEGAWDGLFHFAGTAGAPDFAFPTTIRTLEATDLGPASIIDAHRSA